MKKPFAALLALTLAGGSFAGPAPLPASTGGQLAPVTITAPRPESERIKQLKVTRAIGGAAAFSGLGAMTWAVFFAGTGPIGWAAGLLFAGGMTAYLAHRALRGQDDFTSAARTRAGATPPSR